MISSDCFNKYNICHTQPNPELVTMALAKVPLSYNEDGNHLRYSNNFQLSISRRKPGAIGCKWLCNVANNGSNSKDKTINIKQRV